jgi:hypothetical protein
MKKNFAITKNNNFCEKSWDRSHPKLPFMEPEPSLWALSPRPFTELLEIKYN